MGVTRKLRRHGVKRPHQVRREAKRAHLPLPNALAMLEMETGCPARNIFGCDYGAGTAFCHQKVTKARVKALRKSSLSNGIGWTQITYKPLVPHYGGRWGRMHKPREQMKVGFRHLAYLIREHGQQQGHTAYNGSGPAAQAYGRRSIELARKWQRVIR